MISINQENRLGGKAYVLMLLKAFIPPVIILAIAIVALISSKGIASLIIVFAGHEAEVTYYVNYGVMIVFAFFAVSFFMSFITTRVNYLHYTFTFEEFGLRLRRGLVRMTEITIPYRQMQDVEIERGFFHQITGTSRVVINSAGHAESATRFMPAEEVNIVLDPVDKALAEDVRVFLQRKIGVQVVEGEREADREALEQSAVGSQQSAVSDQKPLPPQNTQNQPQ